MINLVALCQKYQTLPRAGGLLDQDSLFVHLAQVVQAAQTEKEKIEEAKNNRRR